MKYQEFVEIMKEEVQKGVEKECCVTVTQTIKNNNEEKIGLVLKNQNSNIAPAIYLEAFYEQYIDGANIETLVTSIINFYHDMKLPQDICYEKLKDFEYVKDRIAFKLVSKKNNSLYLQNAIYKEFYDFAVVPYVLFEKEDTKTITIGKKHLEIWNVTEHDIFEFAKKNTPQLLPVKFHNMMDTMYVLTNEPMCYGAGTIFYDGIAEQIFSEFGETYFILPSSVHETILVPKSFNVDVQSLKELVTEINKKEVAPEEVLTNSIYYFDGTKILQLA